MVVTPPLVPPVVASRFPSRGERVRIADRIRPPRISLRTTAAEPSHPVSAISREPDRNRQPDSTHQPSAAHEMAALPPSTGHGVAMTAENRPPWRASQVQPIGSPGDKTAARGSVDNSAVAGVAVDNPT